MSPKARCPFLKLLVNRTSEVYGEFNCVIHGDESNAAVFWLQYLDAHHGRLDLPHATSVAAMTVLMGHQISPDTVDGLELYQYVGGKWKSLSGEGIRKVERRFVEFQNATKAAALGLVRGL